MGTVLLVALAAVVAAVVVTGLVRAGRREAQAENARLADEARWQARRSLEAVWAMHLDIGRSGTHRKLHPDHD